MPQRRVGRAWKRLPSDAHKQRRLSLQGQQSRLAYKNAFNNEFLRRASAGALRELGGEHSEDVQREYSGSNDSSHTSNEGSAADTEHSSSNEGSVADTEQQLSERRLRYHSSSRFHTREGYLGGLTERQLLALCALRSRCYNAHEQPLEHSQQQQQHGHVDISSITATVETHLREDTDLCLLRFLRTHKWDVDLTLTALAANVAWRCEQKTALMRCQRPSQVLGCSEQTVNQIVSHYYPHWYLGDDRHGRPVLLYKYGKFDTGAAAADQHAGYTAVPHLGAGAERYTASAQQQSLRSHCRDVLPDSRLQGHGTAPGTLLASAYRISYHILFS
jgi:hypothetical protein